MGREAKRVTLDFDWPVGQLWEGYLLPDRLIGQTCTQCEGTGSSPTARYYENLWYGSDGVRFSPHSTGSTPYTEDTPQVRERAERNVKRSPQWYGGGETAVRREAQRLALLFNSQWCHHLGQDDVDALVAADRLGDFPYTWHEQARKHVVSAAQVNLWSISAGSLGHDAINRWVCVWAKCQRLGVPATCQVCDGHGRTEVYPGQRAEAEAWEPCDPPEGEGWQLWSTTTEGHPMTPVFATAEALARHCADERVSVFGDGTVSFQGWMSIITGKDFAHVEVAPGAILI